MSIVKRELSTDHLPAHLTDQQRYLRFSELLDHYSKTGEFDRAEALPFRASVRSVGIGTMVIGRARGTIGTVRRGRRQILAGNAEEMHDLERNRLAMEEELADNVRLSCQVHLLEDLQVRVINQSSVTGMPHGPRPLDE